MPESRPLCRDTRIIDALDQTFTGAGKIGVWTKANSGTYFDDFTVEPLGGAQTDTGST